MVEVRKETRQGRRRKPGRLVPVAVHPFDRAAALDALMADPEMAAAGGSASREPLRRLADAVFEHAAGLGIRPFHAASCLGSPRVLDGRDRLRADHGWTLRLQVPLLNLMLRAAAEAAGRPAPAVTWETLRTYERQIRAQAGCFAERRAGDEGRSGSEHLLAPPLWMHVEMSSGSPTRRTDAPSAPRMPGQGTSSARSPPPVSNGGGAGARADAGTPEPLEGSNAAGRPPRSAKEAMLRKLAEAERRKREQRDEEWKRGSEGLPAKGD